MRIATKKLVLCALMTAIVFLITFAPFLQIPSPISQGYYNIGDTAVMIAAILLGRRYGFVAGAFGSALADLARGSFIFVPITFIVKGIEGYIVGAIARGEGENQPSNLRKILAVSAGALEMVVGYFIFELVVLRMIDKSLSVIAIVTDLPGNLIQGALSAVLALVFLTVLYRTKAVKKLLR